MHECAYNAARGDVLKDDRVCLFFGSTKAVRSGDASMCILTILCALWRMAPEVYNTLQRDDHVLVLLLTRSLSLHHKRNCQHQQRSRENNSGKEVDWLRCSTEVHESNDAEGGFSQGQEPEMEALEQGACCRRAWRGSFFL